MASLAVVSLAGLAACGGEGGSDGAPGDTAPGSAGAPPGVTPGGPGSQGAIMEMRQIQKQLRGLRQKALQDSSLARRLEGLRAMIDSTMRAMSPQAGPRMDRMDSIRGEMQTARSESDTARLRSLVREGRQLQRALRKLRQQAMEQEDVAAALEDFRSALRERMREVDPATDSLMTRADTLRRRMQSQLRGMADSAAAAQEDTADGGPGG